MNAPAPITFFCVHCGTKLIVPFELAGESGPCPQCAEIITSPLVANLPRPVASAPVSPVPAPPEDWHRDFDLPPMSGLPGGVGPLERGTPGLPGTVAPEALPRHRPAAAGRRRSATARGDFPLEVNPARFDEPAPARPFPVALVSLLLVVLGGSGYLSWRMGWWGPAEAVPLAGAEEGRDEPMPMIAKVDPLPVLEASGNPVASSGAGPAGVEVPPAFREAQTPKPEPKAVGGLSESVLPPEPRPLDSVSAEAPPQREEVQPGISEPRLAVAPPEPVKAPPGAASGGGAALEKARSVIREFLEAESWKGRVGLVEVEGDPTEALSRYYQRNPDIAVRNYRLDFFHTEESAAAGATAHIFFLTLANETDGFPIMVLERNGRFRVDWGLYVEFRQKAFRKFVEDMPAGSARFRVVLQRVTYSEADRDEVPGLDQMLCYKVDPPYPGMTRFAFVDKEKPIGKQLAREISWESDPLAAEVELKWETFPSGKRYLTIAQLVSASWVRTVSPKVAQP